MGIQKALIPLAIAAVTLAGCQNKIVWDKSGATAVDFDKAKLECEYEAAKATASGGNFGMSSAVGAGIAEGMKRQELGTMCLRSKGWTSRQVTS